MDGNVVWPTEAERVRHTQPIVWARPRRRRRWAAGEVSPGDIADHGWHMVLEEEAHRSRLRAAAG
ncbi:hypothetical protein ACWEO2_04370 [Nocardia sp. NPDC004278]